MRSIKELTNEELWGLRQEIDYRSIYLADYENSYDIDLVDCYRFFNAYLDYIWDMGVKDGLIPISIDDGTIGERCYNIVDRRYDNKTNLRAFFKIHFAKVPQNNSNTHKVETKNKFSYDL